VMSTATAAARVNSSRRAVCVASVVPLPGSASPIASVRQFIELAVNIPEQEPHVGQAASSSDSSSASDTEGSAAATIESIRSSERMPDTVLPKFGTGPFDSSVLAMTFPASMGPPDTNTVGMLSRIAAISIPGVIL